MPSPSVVFRSVKKTDPQHLSLHSLLNAIVTITPPYTFFTYILISSNHSPTLLTSLLLISWSVTITPYFFYIFPFSFSPFVFPSFFRSFRLFFSFFVHFFLLLSSFPLATLFILACAMLLLFYPFLIATSQVFIQNKSLT